MNPLTDTLNATFSSAMVSFVDYLPRFIGGLLVLIVGLIVAGIAKKIILGLFKALRVSKFLVAVKMVKEEGEFKIWEVIIAELLRWSLTILFLVPAAEAWGLSKVTDILNELLLYLPNVFVAVIVALVGVVISNLSGDVVKQGAKSLGSGSANTLSTVASYAILFFTVLIVLNQLGVASDLVRILFTGFVAMLALAGGLAFGLGGRDTAAEILKDMRKKLEK